MIVVVGPAGVEPTTFTRNRKIPSLRVSPRSRISSSQIMVSKPMLISGALNGWHRLPVLLSPSLSSAPSKDRAWLDYGPLHNNLQFPNIYISWTTSETLKKQRWGLVVGLPAIGCGIHLIPFRTQKLNHAPFPVLVWSSATWSRESWQSTFPI